MSVRFHTSKKDQHSCDRICYTSVLSVSLFRDSGIEELEYKRVDELQNSSIRDSPLPAFRGYESRVGRLTVQCRPYMDMQRLEKSKRELLTKFGHNSTVGLAVQKNNSMNIPIRVQIYAISFKDYEPYATPVLLDQISHLLAKDLRRPQSHLSLEKNKDWPEAVSVAELLHSCFRLCASII